MFLVRAHNPKVVSSNLTPATMGDRVVLETMGKALLISPQPRTHQVMYTPVTEFVHLLYGFVRRPIPLSHAIYGDHHSSAVIP